MQTAVKWLRDRLYNPDREELFNQALAMEKEQIMDAFWHGDNSDCTSEQNSKEFAEDYYKKTYNHDKTN
jgi:hypothetical protein